MKDKSTLFFHLDLDEATKFKYENNVEEWKKAFGDFFGGWTKYLMQSIEDRAEACSIDLPQMEFWKGLGDAQVHTVEFSGADQAYCYTLACYDAFHLFSEYLESLYGLGLKATAWFATFPEINLELTTPTGHDYIGPDIDIGFRLSSVAQSKRVILAMDLAVLISYSSLLSEVTFHHVGWRSLKGVHRNVPYPIILLNGVTKIEVPIWECHQSDLTRNFLNREALSPEEIRGLVGRYKRDLKFDKEKV